MALTVKSRAETFSSSENGFSGLRNWPWRLMIKDLLSQNSERVILFVPHPQPSLLSALLCCALSGFLLGSGNGNRQKGLRVGGETQPHDFGVVASLQDGSSCEAAPSPWLEPSWTHTALLFP